ncbi:MAG: DUF302 domain-containing protein [Steroidobacteraceae bacterium]
MSYHFSKTVNLPFDQAIAKVTAELAARGFGVLTEIDVAATLRKKINVEFRPYRILGACNPRFAYQALSAEDKIGTMLPCNVIVQELGPGRVEVSAVDPIASMQAVRNPSLEPIATQVQGLLKECVEAV